MNTSKYNSIPFRSSEITPLALYMKRRDFFRLAGTLTVGALLAACTNSPKITPTPGLSQATLPMEKPSPSALADELGSPATSYDMVTGINNFYEFSMNKDGVGDKAKGFITHPWQVEVAGLVRKPRIFTLDDLLKFPQEERVYRMRCVEGWSMVIPWIGFPLSSLLKEVEPTGDARFVSFTSASRPEEMPEVSRSPFFWPYKEGLRLDEAMNSLTILSTGLYGENLLNQNGAPIRLVVPWKYGYKSAKSIVKIELVAKEPPTFWSAANPDEYGFYSNVNPDRSHPRWSQANERRVGESENRPTLMFNGYAGEVASMYKGMDLDTYF